VTSGLHFTADGKLCRTYDTEYLSQYCLSHCPHKPLNRVAMFVLWYKFAHMVVIVRILTSESHRSIFISEVSSNEHTTYRWYW